MDASQNRRFYFEYRFSSFWPTYIGERRTTFAKAYGIKVRCYGEHVGEHIENLIGTHWELERNKSKAPHPQCVIVYERRKR
jgi:predicted metalloprotease